MADRVLNPNVLAATAQIVASLYTFDHRPTGKVEDNIARVGAALLAAVPDLSPTVLAATAQIVVSIYAGDNKPTGKVEDNIARVAAALTAVTVSNRSNVARSATILLAAEETSSAE
jgi:hypothetical protein